MGVELIQPAIWVKLGVLSWTNQLLLSMDKRESITAGNTAVHILPSVAGFDGEDSNQGYTEAHYAITFAHRLADSTHAVEFAYVQNTMPPQQEVVMAKSFYSTVAGVHEVKSLALTPAERIGNVIEWTVDVQLTVSP